MSIDLTNRRTQEELEKLTMPTNDGLHALFSGIDGVVFKKGGVNNEKAMTDEVVLNISSGDKIEQLKRLLEIDEATTGFYCMCSGDYAIELYASTALKATIGFHHGVSIRYFHWNSDAAFAKSDELLNFLAAQGFTQPLEDRQEAIKSQEADRVAERNWLAVAPACFARYWEQINNIGQVYLPMLIADLDDEIPNKQQQIIALLQTFGYTDNFWTAYPSYEAVPQNILLTFPVSTIIEAYENSDRNYKTRRGLGRFLCSFDFKKVRKKYLKYIPQEVIADLEKCFQAIGETHGIYELNKLKKQKGL